MKIIKETIANTSTHEYIYITPTIPETVSREEEYIKVNKTNGYKYKMWSSGELETSLQKDCSTTATR